MSVQAQDQTQANKVTDINAAISASAAQAGDKDAKAAISEKPGEADLGKSPEEIFAFKESGEGEAESAEALTPQKFKFGNKEFDSQEEVDAYLTKLENDKLEREAYQKGMEAAQEQLKQNTKKAEDMTDAEVAEVVKTVEPIIIDGHNIAELMFEEPEKAMSLLQDAMVKQAVQQARVEITEEQTQRETQQKLWNDFYAQNSDFVEHKDIVDLIFQSNYNELAKLPVDEAMNVLSEKTWQKLRKIRGISEETQTLGDAMAQTAGTSRAHAPAKNVQEAPKELDFISQLNKLRTKG